MNDKKINFDEIVTEIEKGDPGVTEPTRIKHLSIRWVLMSILGIIFIWGTIILVEYFRTMPQIPAGASEGVIEAYAMLLNAHIQKFKDLAQFSFIVLIPVFSTLAGSYIRGGGE
ncbi:MAG: hypothetical protein KAR21_02475 [Spirochaetales bacterium]|nr:hypothetical protein [Spirochaetales bacterium]